MMDAFLDDMANDDMPDNDLLAADTAEDHAVYDSTMDDNYTQDHSPDPYDDMWEIREINQMRAEGKEVSAFLEDGSRNPEFPFWRPIVTDADVQPEEDEDASSVRSIMAEYELFGKDVRFLDADDRLRLLDTDSMDQLKENELLLTIRDLHVAVTTDDNASSTITLDEGLLLLQDVQGSGTVNRIEYVDFDGHRSVWEGDRF